LSQQASLQQVSLALSAEQQVSLALSAEQQDFSAEVPFPVAWEQAGMDIAKRAKTATLSMIFRFFVMIIVLEKIVNVSPNNIFDGLTKNIPCLIFIGFR